MLKRAGLLAAIVVAGVLSLARGFAAPGLCKTVRVEHGRPVVIVSERSVLLLEFAAEPHAEALVPNADPDIRHCRARYRYEVYEGDGGSLTNGQGLVEEVLKTVARTPAGNRVEDAGSQVNIRAGEFGITWSEATAGARSWLYYRSDSPIRFLQQPQAVPFDAVDREQFRRYLSSRNVQEFVAAGHTVQVIGPAVFSGELPTEQPVSARIESGRVHEGVFELTLSNLATNQNYAIQSSYDPGQGNWTVVHTFVARASTRQWSDPLGKDVNMAFYRVLEDAH